MRHRFTIDGGYDSPQVKTTKTWTCAGSSPTVTTSTDYAGTVRRKDIWDVQTPNFQSLLECGKFLPLNPVTIVTETTTLFGQSYDHKRYYKASACPSNPGKVQSDISGPRVKTRGYSFDAPPVDPEALITVVNEAVAEARNGAWDVLTDIAELRELGALVKGNWAKTLSYAYRALRDAHFRRNLAKKWNKKDRRSKVKSLYDYFSSAWLEYRYGWMPILYSTQDAVKAFSAEEQKWYKGRGYQQFQDTISVTHPEETFSSWKEQWTEELEYTHKVRGWAAAEFRTGTGHRFQADPITTAWELVPFSFVVDWFIQVGSYLGAVSPFTSGRTLGSCVSVQTSCKWRLYEHIWDIPTSSTTGDGDNTALMAEVTRESYTRYPGSPSLPGWNPRLNLPRFVDMIALFSGQSRELMRRLRE